MAEKEIQRIIPDGDIERKEDLDWGVPLPTDNDIRRGLVASGDRIFERRPRSVWASVFIPESGEKRDKRLLRIFGEEREKLVSEMTEKGLFGQHPLVSLEVIREQVSSFGASAQGSLFGSSANLEGETKGVSTVLFAWKTHQDKIVVSQTDLSKIEIELNPSAIDPKVELQFDSTELVHFYWFRIVRRSYVHPNGFISRALSKATFTATSQDQLKGFLLPKLK